MSDKILKSLKNIELEAKNSDLKKTCQHVVVSKYCDKLYVFYTILLIFINIIIYYSFCVVEKLKWKANNKIFYLIFLGIDKKGYNQCRRRDRWIVRVHSKFWRCTIIQEIPLKHTLGSGQP